jgi:hypothetical protein
MRRAFYRSRQVFFALFPRLSRGDIRFAREHLSERQTRLFLTMELRDQRHAVEVARRLRRGTDDEALLAAALLHDCGKGNVPVWLRVLNVASADAVGLLAKEGAGWRGSAYRLKHHVELSARLADEAGSAPMSVRLIRGEVQPDEAWRYELLMAADDVS